MIYLKNWYITKLSRETGEIYYNAHGIVLGHPKLQEGIDIHTSVIKTIKLDNENNCLIMRTRSGSEYELSFASISFETFDETQACLETFNIDKLSLEQCEELHKEEEKQFLSKVEASIKSNELYLGIIGMYVQKAYFKNNTGTIRELHVKPHIGMLQDSYLITDWKKGEVDFRYFDKFDGIEPYHWSDGLEAILIDNMGTSNIKFFGTDKTIICQSGVTRIEKEVYRGEGLFTPDVVNGKGLFSEMAKEHEDFE